MDVGDNPDDGDDIDDDNYSADEDNEDDGDNDDNDTASTIFVALVVVDDGFAFRAERFASARFHASEYPTLTSHTQHQGERSRRGRRTAFRIFGAFAHIDGTRSKKKHPNICARTHT